MYYKIKQLAVITILTIGLFSCNKREDPDPVDNTAGEVHLNFKNYVGDNALVLDSETYTNPAGEQFTISMFNYYISNIKLKKADGTEYAEPESYHLIRHSEAGSAHFHIANVPAGEYTSMSFLIGVDEARNTSGAQTGALDQANGMFWTWQTGYIMAKLEGNSAAAASSGKFMYHIGGFNGENTGIRTVTIAFPSAITVSGSSSGDVVLKADAMKWFGPTNIISIAALSTIMLPNPTSKKIADNYASMITLTEAKSVAE